MYFPHYIMASADFLIWNIFLPRGSRWVSLYWYSCFVGEIRSYWLSYHNMYNRVDSSLPFHQWCLEEKLGCISNAFQTRYIHTRVHKYILVWDLIEFELSLSCLLGHNNGLCQFFLGILVPLVSLASALGKRGRTQSRSEVFHSLALSGLEWEDRICPDFEGKSCLLSFTEPQNHKDWKGLLQIIKTNTLQKQVPDSRLHRIESRWVLQSWLAIP